MKIQFIYYSIKLSIFLHVDILYKILEYSFKLINNNLIQIIKIVNLIILKR
jgi:hypothetical protein